MVYLCISLGQKEKVIFVKKTFGKSALNNYKKNMDANRKGDAACYDSFFKYCEEEGLSKYPLKKLFVEYISMHSIVEACRTYVKEVRRQKRCKLLIDT